MISMKTRIGTVAAALALGACAGPATTNGGDPPGGAGAGDVARYFPQLAEYPQRIRMEALLGGRLLIEDGCFRLRGGSGETRLLVWAPDAVLLADRRRVRSATGAVARAGDTIEFSGGEVSVEGISNQRLAGTLPSECRGPYAVMSEGFSVRWGRDRHKAQ